MMRASALAMVLIGCGPSAGGEDLPPTLEVVTPERGTTSEGREVSVTGRVTDDHPGVRVTVNGVDAEVDASGNFAALVSVEDGIGVIETHATDASENDVRDVRAVLAGTLVPSDGSLGAPIAARIGTSGLTKLGTVLATQAQALDWNALGLAMNPVYNSSGCNSARLDIEQLSVGTIGVALVPTEGSLQLVVTLDNVYVRMHADFEALCIDGSTTVEVRSTRATVTGNLVLAVNAGQLGATLPTSTVQLQGFSLNVGGVPGVIEDLIDGEARKAAEKALNDAVRDEVPAQASEALGGLLAEPIATSVLERPTTFTITPDSVAIGPDGLVVAADSRIVVQGGEGGVYASTPNVASSGIWLSSDLGIALADDVLNQLFSGLWASGAIAPALTLDGDASIITAFLDDDARAVKLEMPLPPQVNARDGVLELAIGDLVMSVRDAGDVEIQRFAITIVTSLAASPDGAGGISVAVGDPVIKAQMLVQTDVVDEPMTSEKLEGIVGGAWGLVGQLVDDAMANLPLPSVSGLTLGGPSLQGRGGFVVVDIPIQ